MLKTKILHPEILDALGRAGHSSQILIADGNFPFATRRGPQSRLVFLNFMPGLLTVTQILEGLLAMVPIEAAQVMEPLRSGPYAMTGEPEIFQEFRQQLSAQTPGLGISSLERFAFYDAASSPNVCLTICSGEERIYANLLLTIGVVRR